MSVLARDYGLRIISGGQTGVDLAGLRAAQSLGIMTGGAAPSRFKTLKGSQPELALFGLRETPGSGYAYRTLRNVQDSDATLIIAQDMESSGTKLTVKYCSERKKPCYKLKVNRAPTGFSLEKDELLEDTAVKIVDLMKAKLMARPQDPFVLNIAGNSSKSAPQIFLAGYLLTMQLLRLLETKLSNSDPVSEELYNRVDQLCQVHIAMQLEDVFDHVPQLDPRRATLVMDME